MSNEIKKIAKITKIPCAIYTRKSHEEGLDQDFNSLDAQFESCRAFITSQAHLGWEFVQKYEDPALSGGNLNRPALQMMMTDIKAGKIKCVVVYKVDRLSRSLFDFSKLMDVFETQEISFVSITQSFNTANAMGKLMLNVLLSFAQFEREVTSERIRDKLSASKKKGIWVGGYVPLGYLVENRKLLPNENELELAKLIFEKYLEIKTIKNLVVWLNENGYRKKSWIGKNGEKMGGQKFDKMALSRMLKNPIYIGKISHQDKIYEGEHDGIIDKKVFNQVQDLLKENHRNFPQNYSKNTLLLSDKIFDTSGEKFTCDFTKKGTKYYRYYLHSKVRLNAHEFDEICLNMLSQLLENPELINDEILTLKLKQINSQNLQNLAKNLITKVIYEADKITILIKKSNLDNLQNSENLQPTFQKLNLNPIVVNIDEEFIYLSLKISLHSKIGGTIIKTLDKPKHPQLNNLIQGYKWQKMLESGKSIQEIASHANKDKSYVQRLIKLAYSNLETLETIIGD